MSFMALYFTGVCGALFIVFGVLLMIVARQTFLTLTVVVLILSGLQMVDYYHTEGQRRGLEQAFDPHSITTPSGN